MSRIAPQTDVAPGGAVARETPAASSSSVARETPRPAGAPAWLILAPIRLYRRFVSPAISNRCRYYPSCSAYAEQAIRELGAVRGTILAAWRVLRCNPFSRGGVDHVADRRLFRDPPPSNDGRTA